MKYSVIVPDALVTAIVTYIVFLSFSVMQNEISMNWQYFYFF